MTKCTTKPSGMLVVIAKKEDIKVIGELVERGGMEVACYNTQSQLVIAGAMEKAKDLYAEMKKKKIISTFLPVSAAFHCKELKAMVPEFESHLKTLNIQPPKATIYRNIDAKPYKAKEDIIEGLTKQLYCPVMFEKAIRLVPKSVEF
jgi:acyl transferase domain-containing protein